MTKARCWIEKDWGGGSRLIIIEDIKPGKIRVAGGFTWSEYEEGFLFDRNEGIGQADELIQAIVDRAWEAGFRPSGFRDIKNETAALREHLSDMRTVAFHKLGIKPV